MGIKKRRMRAGNGGHRTGGRRNRAAAGNIAEASIGTGADTEASGAGDTTSARTGEGPEGVGVLHVSNAPNRVDVDPERISLEIDAAVAEANAASASEAPVVEPVPPPPSPWAPLAPGIVQVLDVFIWPNWSLSARENEALEQCLPPVLDDLFPGGLGSEKWAPYFRLAFVVGGIAISRIDRKSGTLRPLREPPPESEPEAAVRVSPSEFEDVTRKAA